MNGPYGRAAGELWVNLYGASEVSTDLGDGRTVALRQDTQYPWDGTVELTVMEASGSPFSLVAAHSGLGPAVPRSPSMARRGRRRNPVPTVASSVSGRRVTALNFSCLCGYAASRLTPRWRRPVIRWLMHEVPWCIARRPADLPGIDEHHRPVRDAHH